MEKTINEVKVVLNTRRQENPGDPFKYLAVGLTSRKNLCIQEKVCNIPQKDKIDSECKKLTAHWVREKHNQSQQSNWDLLCKYFEEF